MKLKQGTLPNGMEVHYSSKPNLELLQRETFGDSLYLKHGIQVNEGDVIFDVGANIGFFVMFLNEHLENASVFSFEPIPDTYTLLDRNVRLHNRLQLKLYNCGLSNEPGTATFTHYPKNDVCSTMCPQGSTEYRRNSRKFVLDEIRKRGAVLRFLVDHTPGAMWFPITESVRRYYRSAIELECQLRTISELIDENSLKQIDYLKVDTEGSEMQVLGGIRPEHWPMVKQVVVEVHEGKPAMKQVTDLLRKNGFQLTVEQPCDTLNHLHMVYATRTPKATSNSNGSKETAVA